MIVNSSYGVIAAGRATKDAEFKTVGDKGTHLTKFSIVGIDGTPQKPTTFINVIAWFDLADYTKSIRKGDRVFVAGIAKNADYTNKDGELVKKSELVADFVQIQQKIDKAEPIYPQMTDDFFTTDESADDDDLPF